MANRLDGMAESRSNTESFKQRLLREKPFQTFINTIDSPYTLDFYVYCLSKFMKHQKAKSTHDLLKAEPKLIEARIIQYVVENKSLLSAGTLRSYLAAVRHFYTMNDAVVNWKKITKHIGKGSKKHQDRGYTHEEIQLLLNTTDLRGKAILLLLASTGCRVGALPLLKRKHLHEIEEAGQKFYKITVYAGSKEEYVTFCTPECRKAIDAYFEFRQRSGELFRPDAPVIREQFDINDTLIAAHPKQVKPKGIQSLVKKMLITSGLRNGEQPLIEGSNRGKIRHEVHQLHGFRKFFNTTLKNSDIKPLFVELWLGHRTGLESAYFRPSEHELSKEYAKAIDILSIDPTNRLAKEVNQLSSKNLELTDVLTKRIEFLETAWKEAREMNKEALGALEETKHKSNYIIDSLVKKLEKYDPTFKDLA